MFKLLKKDKAKDIKAPVNGLHIKMEEVKDEVFASKMMGDGIAIIPSDLKVYAPVTGTITMVADTRHAVGIKMVDGLEILIHFGIDTVNLKGEGIKAAVVEGQKVKEGDLLLEGDEKFLKEKHIDTTIMVIVLDDRPVKEVYRIGENVKKGESIMKV